MSTSSNDSWAPSRPLDRGNAAHRILQDLRLDILGGRFPRGGKLPTERELAAGYGVSGATVREAVRGLIASGLVEVRHGSGAYVTGDPAGLLDAPLRSMIQMERIGVPEVLGVLKALNMYAAELAATRAVAQETGRLRAALVALETARDADELSLRLIAFLSELTVISGNPLLAVLSGFLSGIQVDLAMQLSGGTFAAWRKTVRRLSKERERLVAAIEARDAPAARQAASDYHDRAIKVITALPSGDSARVGDPLLASLIAGSQRGPTRRR
ncbi:MAG: bacterial regulatory s, gntR family protein [Ramlibacter sp.]|nr:bacterial regulatory s, gntR family protein [Ramlibacter sp.]